MQLRAIRRRVIVRPDEPVSETAGGIIIPDQYQEAPSRATVLSVGCDVTLVKPGERVVLRKLEGEMVKFPGEPELISLTEDHVLGVIEEDSDVSQPRHNRGASGRGSP